MYPPSSGLELSTLTVVDESRSLLVAVALSDHVRMGGQSMFDLSKNLDRNQVGPLYPSEWYGVCQPLPCLEAPMKSRRWALWAAVSMDTGRLAGDTRVVK